MAEEYNKNTSFGLDFAVSLGGLVSGIAQSEAMRVQGDYYKKIGEINARFSEMEARDVIKSGDQEASEHGKTINQMVGDQRANLASQGINIGSGTALAIQNQTREIGYAEQRNIRNNAFARAFGLKTDAFNSRTQGGAQARQATFQANNTIVTSGLGFAQGVASSYRDNFQNNKTTEKPKPAETFEISKYGQGEMKSRTA